MRVYLSSVRAAQLNKYCAACATHIVRLFNSALRVRIAMVNILYCDGKCWEVLASVRYSLDNTV